VCKRDRVVGGIDTVPSDFEERVFTSGISSFTCAWCEEMVWFFVCLFCLTRPLYPERVLESRPPASRYPGQRDI
jgi:hypothetical protein